MATGACDKTAKMMDVQSGTVTQVAQHDQPISSVRWVDGTGNMAHCLATASWDKTLRVEFFLKDYFLTVDRLFCWSSDFRKGSTNRHY